MNRMSVKSRHIGLVEFNQLLVDAPESERWELVGGRVLKMMVGARRKHAHIVNNLHGLLWQGLRANGSRCHAYSESSRVQVDEAEASFLPDIVVTCEPIEGEATFLKAPTVLMEVLSDSTASRDRIEKWAAYKALASLRNYALVHSDRPHVEIFNRQDDGWSSQVLAGLGATLDLPALDLSIPLAEIYADLFS